MSIRMKVKKVRGGAVLPQYQTAGAAGADVSACLDKPLTIEPGKRMIIPTGLILEIPLDYEVQVRARSGLAAKHGVGLVNGVGTIDSDYRGELNIILINWSDQSFVVDHGMRIAQLVIARYEAVNFEEASSLSETERGEARFGSTGH